MIILFSPAWILTTTNDLIIIRYVDQVPNLHVINT